MNDRTLRLKSHQPENPPAPVERATVGRRVWYWSGAEEQAPFNLGDPRQPYDAGVIYVNGDGRVNLLVTDHFGEAHPVHMVEMHNPSDEIHPDGPDRHARYKDGYATWMPYHVKKGTGSS